MMQPKRLDETMQVKLATEAALARTGGLPLATWHAFKRNLAGMHTNAGHGLESVAVMEEVIQHGSPAPATTIARWHSRSWPGCTRLSLATKSIFATPAWHWRAWSESSVPITCAWRGCWRTWVRL
jgi:hypothetical protein